MTSRIVTIAVMLLASGIAIGTVLFVGDHAWAQSSGQAKAEVPSGVVKAIATKTMTIEIEGEGDYAREYPISINVTVKDQRGKARELGEIAEGYEVQLRLKQGLVDQIIVTMPQ